MRINLKGLMLMALGLGATLAAGLVVYKIAWMTGLNGHDGGNVEALRRSYEDEVLYRNAIYLYLRLAGVAWTCVEWIAALILWRAYRMLANAVGRREAAHAA